MGTFRRAAVILGTESAHRPSAGQPRPGWVRGGWDRPRLRPSPKGGFWLCSGALLWGILWPPPHRHSVAHFKGRGTESVCLRVPVTLLSMGSPQSISSCHWPRRGFWSIAAHTSLPAQGQFLTAAGQPVPLGLPDQPSSSWLAAGMALPWPQLCTPSPATIRLESLPRRPWPPPDWEEDYLGQELIGRQLVDPTRVPFSGIGRLSPHLAAYDLQNSNRQT